jgi:AraC family transcriptional regulator
MSIENVLYLGVAKATGGRDGRAISFDGALDVRLSTTRELGRSGGAGTTPEQLFVAGYSACFLSAMKLVATRDKITSLGDASLRASVVQAVSKLAAMRPREWMNRVISLLEAAVGQLHDQEHPAQGTLLEAAYLLRQQVYPTATADLPDGRGRLLAWQARKVRDYIDTHISGPVLVADLCALVQRSEAHFSRSFKRTFGESPHSFVVRCRVELAAQYMLTTDASLSDIALRCGFTDQAHLCRHFRQTAGQTPAAWRRAHRLLHDKNGTPPVERFATASRSGTQLTPRTTPRAPSEVLMGKVCKRGNISC